MLVLGACRQQESMTVAAIPSGSPDSSAKLPVITETIDTLPAMPQDSAELVQPETTFAFDKLKFGMHPVEAKKLLTPMATLGKYTYKITPSYNQNKELYLVRIKSSEIKAIAYEADLQAQYFNLCRVISEKYGGKKSCRELPSIFDVMNAGTMYLNKWDSGEKSIKLGIAQPGLNSYIVICRISHKTMEKLENEQLKRIRDKDIIKASEKF